MKVFRILLIAIFLFINAKTFAAHQLYADTQSISIPYGTKLELYMAQDITTKNIIQGDMFQAYLSKDIYVNNKLILPSKTVFRGRVSDIKYSRNLSRPAVLYLALDHLVTKNGTQLPISAGIASDFEYVLKSDGGLTTNGNYLKALSNDAKKGAQMLQNSIKWSSEKSEKMFNGAKYILVPTAAIGGAIGCAGYSIYSTIADIFKHGDEIIINKGTKFNILLLSKLDVSN